MTEDLKDAQSLRLSLMYSTDKPEQPEPLTRIRLKRKFGIPLHSGSLDSIPYIEMMEMDTVIDAENDYYAVRAALLRLKDQQNGNPTQP